MKVLVTGGAGFIGSHVVELLVKEGHEVTVFDDLSNGWETNLLSVHDQIKLVVGDVCDKSQITEAIKGQDFVFHLAAIASVPFSVKDPLKVHNVNATGTLNVLLAARDSKVKRVIYSSTAAVYGDDPSLPKKETSIIKPLSPYALSKFAAERYAVMFTNLYGLPTTCLRYFNVYGPRQDPKSPYSGVISKFADLIKNNQPPTIFGDGLQTRDFIFVGDVVKANLQAMHANVNGVFNIATGSQISIIDLFNAIKDICKSDISPVMAPAQPGDIKHSVADISAAKKHLNFAPKISLKEGLAETIKIKTIEQQR